MEGDAQKPEQPSLHDVLAACHKTCAEVGVILGALMPAPTSIEAETEMVPPTEPITIAARLDRDYGMAEELASHLDKIACHGRAVQRAFERVVR